MPINTSYRGRQMFLDGEVDIARYDVLEYPLLDKLTKTQRGYLWIPEVINDINKDKQDFARLSPHEQHIFTANLKRQTLLDSIQGRAPSEVFTPIASVPEVEAWTQLWAYSETVHAYSYTYIIRNVYADPSKVFDEMGDIEEIVTTSEAISEAYELLDRYNKAVSLFGYGHIESTDMSDLLFGGDHTYNLHDHKKLLWRALMSVNILEGVRFYVSFACSWAFGERKIMEGNAKIIKLIARDENVHLASTQHMLRTLRQRDPEFESIAKELEGECVAMFNDAIQQEKDWAKYLFKDGSMVGLTENILVQYIEYIAKQRLKAVDLPHEHLTATSNPLPWTNNWISGKDVQEAPQETSKTSYRVGAVKADLTNDLMKDIKLD